ncbi:MULTISPECIES: protein adenylyltransferase SelO [unclassified Pseudoclavibacter]|uniref:protein adenylyltransferase SelO n=1 Tax=unclassified Pseudoclavibacter TaxID=2615177 RepID=UPI001BA7C6A8|nr:YdiU family protein [Pseudoclavibacter sp. Marseille-Q4354]MBS3179227.1 YdiU family protein [Pseudoclavibacter sp. Marseille-Q4354]
MTATTHAGVTFGNRFARELPELSAPWEAEPAPAPHLVLLNEALAVELGFDAEFLRSSDGVSVLLGASVPEGATPVAQAYAGHQFGQYSPHLGDGRALLLGEVTDTRGRLRDIHLKGSGRTAFARGGDGRAVLGPMLREFIVSEAMHALGIPTTRSLSVTLTGRQVQRDDVLPGAVLTRVASSHLRVGSFQFARATGDLELLRRLADHAIARHFPSAAEAANPYLAFFERVVSAQAKLIAQWMLVGFVHGVMNTDNMTISGETIDYGPCAFLDAFDPDAVFSSIDIQGRYSFRNQPHAAGWNLARFAETLLPLFADDEDAAVALAEQAVSGFGPVYQETWVSGMRSKLGLPGDVAPDTFERLLGELLTLMQRSGADYTSTFRALGAYARGNPTPALDIFGEAGPAFRTWAQAWLALSPNASAMDAANPVYIPRNHLVEDALEAALDDELEPTRRLLAAVTAPFDERPGLDRYATGAPQDFGDYVTFCGT